MPRPLVSLLCLLMVSLAASGIGPARSAERAKPNLLLLLADDLGYECLSANGSASYRTPNLDRLAESGARFTHCYTPPLCTPTRVQLMTGRYNFRNYSAFGILAKGEPTFARMLNKAGYATAIAGKWQLDEGEGQTPPEAGLDEYCLWNIYQNGKWIRGERYADPNFLVYDRASRQAAPRTFTGEYGPDVARAYLTEFIQRSARAKQPFLAYYPMLVTHGAFQPTPDSPEWKTGNRHQKNDRFFKDMVEYMDVEVGKVLHTLDELGVRENTLVLFVGDNGTAGSITSAMKDGRTIAGAKGRLTDAGTHVPMIASWPGTIRPGQVRDDLVDTSDFLPTLADAAGASLPDATGDGVLDGRSFLPQLKGQKGSPREWVLIDYRAGKGPGRNDGRFARDRRWKLYGAAKDGQPLYQSGKLFDISRDPEEKSPAPAGKPEADAARARLQKVLDSAVTGKAVGR